MAINDALSIGKPEIWPRQPVYKKQVFKSWSQNLDRLLNRAFSRLFFRQAEKLVFLCEDRLPRPVWKILCDCKSNCSQEMCVYILLRSLPDYVPVDKLVELFEWATIITEMGQTLDMQNSECSTVDLNHFTEETYSAIVKYKTSVYSFYLPIASGLVAAGQDSNCSQLKEITLQMGHYFQAQDDFIDCFGNPEITGKIGTDIQVSA